MNIAIRININCGRSFGRFRNQLQTLSSGTLSSLSVTQIGFDPTPDDIVNGRKFFYSGASDGESIGCGGISASILRRR